MKLFPYQEYGASWLASKRFALLADEMRVGKSPQSITAADICNAKSILVLGPASSRINWLREFDKWSIFGLTKRAIFTQTDKPLKSGINVVSYDLAIQPTVLRELCTLSPDVLILDESHYLKEPTSQRTHASFGLHGLARRAKKVWCLTGTPMPNGLPSELWVMLHSFGVYRGKFASFQNRFCTGYHDGYQFRPTGGKNLDALKKLMEPIMLRRTMEEVRPEVPSMIYTDVVVEGDNSAIKVEDRMTLVAQNAHIISILRNMPSVQAKAASLKELDNDHVATLRRYTGLAKVRSFAELIKDEINNGTTKLVIFAIHREVIQGLNDALSEFNPIMLWGGVPAAQRQKKIDKFTDDADTQIFIGQIQATKENIDLSVSSDIFFCESSWTPGDNDQASKRCGNVNKMDPVTVRFVSLAGSHDEVVQRVQVRKMETISELFD